MHKWNSLTKTDTGELNLSSNDNRRLKRQTSNTVCTQPNCVCPMHLVATHLFHQQYAPTNNVDDTILFMVSSDVNYDAVCRPEDNVIIIRLHSCDYY